jgi:type I restriction enzyme, S subunit
MTTNEWELVRIRDIGKVVTGRTPPTAVTSYFGDEYPFITPSDMIGDKYISNPERGLSSKGATLLKNNCLPPKSIAVSCIGWQMGKVVMISRTSFTNQQINTIISNDHVEPDFIYYSLCTRREELKTLGSVGTRTPILIKSSFENFQVLLPPIPTQHKIAAILSAYDALIENNTRRIAILEEMVQSLYREWFVHFRFPGHEKKRLVESELGLIPEGWEVKQLSEVCSRITDGSHWSPKTVDCGYPMASVKDMHDWGFNIDQCRTIAKEDYETLVRNDCKPVYGDVLIAKDGSYLKHIFVMEKELDIVILSSIAILRPNNKILPYILSLYLREPLNKSRLKSFVSGVAIPRIVLKDFAKFLVLLPPRDIQEQFCKLAEPMIVNCFRLIEKNVILRQTRNLLLPKLISGEVDVDGLDIHVEGETYESSREQIPSFS